MKLPPCQEIALRFLAACAWTDHWWCSINAVLSMFGHPSVNGRVIADRLCKRGLAERVEGMPATYKATSEGVALAGKLTKDPSP
jgi:hypothetical protein